MYLYVLKKLTIFKLEIVRNKTGKLVHAERSVVVSSNTEHSSKT